jgi:hypothetical protein
MMRKKFIRVAAPAVMAGALALIPTTVTQAAPSTEAGSIAARPASDAVIDVGGTLNGLPFVGEITNLDTSVVDGVLQLAGTLTGAGLPGPLEFTAPITDLFVDDACTILDLDLGPLHLDVLGLVIDLDEVHLDITAVPGAGNLLGNLLCAVAGLLDNGGPLQGITALLDRLLAGLG